eukprot:2724897-Pleurochrysis_carterae.AAC.1
MPVFPRVTVRRPFFARAWAFVVLAFRYFCETAGWRRAFSRPRKSASLSRAHQAASHSKSNQDSFPTRLLDLLLASTWSWHARGHSRHTAFANVLKEAHMQRSRVRDASRTENQPRCVVSLL